MAFELDRIVPWGRNLKEYTEMFNLSETDLNKNIISFGDDPASFNSELNKLGKRCTSIDPIYRFTKSELEERFKVVKDTVMEQVRKNTNKFVWKNIKDEKELEKLRLTSMSKFLIDFNSGKKENRYISHLLPEKLNFENHQFEIGLSSHFLILYSYLGINFHIQAIKEMLRLCKEIRIFPILNLNGEKSEILRSITEYFNNDYKVEIQKVNYEFQKNGNKMLTII